MLWFSLFDSKEYSGDERVFAELSAVPGIKELEKNYKIVLEELQHYFSGNELENYFNNVMTEDPKAWKVRSLRVWGVEMYQYQKLFPKTTQLLNAIPGVVTISFNGLEPHSVIKPHSGDTNGIIRCHLGLVIPEPAPACALKVKGEVHGWEEGKIFGFMDAYTHEAWNNSDKRRFILLFDIIRPEFTDQKSRICATVLSSLYLQKLGNIFPSLYKINRKIFYLAYPLILFLRVAIPIRNRLKK